MMTFRWIPLGIALMLTVTACEADGERTLGIDATGAVAGIAFVDRNGDGLLGGTDTPLPDLDINLVHRNGRGVVATTRTASNGVFLFRGVRVGEYEVRVAPGSIPDSLRLIRVDSANIRLAAGDTAVAFAVLSYPSVSIAEARRAAVGSTMFIEGVALNAWPAFGDSTVHIMGDSLGIRLLRVIPTDIGANDSVRVLGTRGTRDGQPILHSARLFYLRTVEPRLPAVITTADAAIAGEGRLDALLARILNAPILSFRNSAEGDLILTVDDGSGALEVVLDVNRPWPNLPFTVQRPPATWRISATGLLKPVDDGVWSLKPRARAEIAFSDIPPPDSAAVARRRDPLR
jgi:hypothetical protein